MFAVSVVCVDASMVCMVYLRIVCRMYGVCDVYGVMCVCVSVTCVYVRVV
jgi:hypothetical protein